jgi:hypothetical protein
VTRVTELVLRDHVRMQGILVRQRWNRRVRPGAAVSAALLVAAAA